MSTVLLLIAVPLLGGAGAALRFAIDELVASRRGRDGFPLGLFIVNVTGAFAAGYLVASTLSGDAALLITGAFLGGYTTFSSWMLDTINAEDQGLSITAAANLAGSLIAGFAAAALGYGLA